MALKNLSFPIFMSVAVLIGVFSIKPTVESILDKRAVLAAKADEGVKVDGTVQNLDALYSSRASLLDTAEGKAVYGYLPVSISQDQVVDIFNYYAAQTGVTVNNIAFTDQSGKTSLGASSDGASSDGSTTEVVTIPETPTPASFTMTADIQGPYEGIRAFLAGISHPGRSSVLTSFSIVRQDTTDASGQIVTDVGRLSGTVSAEFFYLPQKKYRNGYMLSVFSGREFNLDAVKGFIAKETAIPPLADPQTVGRSNPFVL